MNSANRHIALLDTALRRRFTFQEMGPETDLLSVDLDGIDLRRLLTTLNERIELLLDRERRLGHAYFIGVQVLDDLNLVFAHQVLPLLAEYFHDDWGQIALVLINRDYDGRVRADRRRRRKEQQIEQRKRGRTRSSSAGSDHMSGYSLRSALTS